MKRFRPAGANAPEILPPIDGSRAPWAQERAPGSSPVAAAGVIHDLGNLIQIAASALNIVSRTPDMPAAHAGPMLDRAKTCLEHAGALVRQNLARMRDRAVGEEQSELVTCLSDIAALVEAMGEPGLRIELDIGDALPIVGCDPLGLRRALLNLVLNAREAMAGSGVVAIRTRTMPLENGAAGVEIQVADRGVGMSATTIARVFDPFFTTREDGIGGVGLPMVERFVRTAGGEVAIASRPGVGTIVTLRLPAAVRRPVEPEEIHP